MASTGENHFRYVARLRTLANVLIELAEFEEADGALAKALEIVNSLSAEPTYQRARVLLHIGQSLNYQSRFDEAEPWLRRALEYPDVLGHDNTLQAKTELAVNLSHQAQYEEAEKLFTVVVTSHEAAEGPDSRIHIPTLTDLAAHYRRKGDLDQAFSVIQRALKIAENTLPQGHWRWASAKAQYAYILKAKNKEARAQEIAQVASVELEKTLNPQDPRLLNLQAFIAKHEIKEN